MSLFDNPFYLIEVSTRASKQEIVEACDARSLTAPADLCARIRADLTAPRSRLEAELTWLPGLSPAHANDLIDKIKAYPTVFSLAGINPLARCNVLSTYLEYFKPKEESHVRKFIVDIVRSFEQIDASSLLSLINEDRQVARIPLLHDKEIIEQEMLNRRAEIVRIIVDSLNNVAAPEKVLTEMITVFTPEGKLPPKLIEEITDKYKIEVQKYLDRLVDQIEKIISSIKQHPQRDFEQQTASLCKYVKLWQQISLPCQLIQHSKGMEDAHSSELGYDLRSLAVDLCKTHDMDFEAKRITEWLIKVFDKLPQLREKFLEDIVAYDRYLKNKHESFEDEVKMREESSIEVDLDSSFLKKRLSINPERIQLGKSQIVTGLVSRVGWASEASGDTWKGCIWVGSNDRTIHFDLTDKNIYGMIIDRIWKVACLRLSMETLAKLTAGQDIPFGGTHSNRVVVRKDGLILPALKVSGPYEGIFIPWHQLRVRNGNGTFVIESARDAGIEMSYKDYDNVHILEHILTYLLKDNNYDKLATGEFSKA